MAGVGGDWEGESQNLGGHMNEPKYKVYDTVFYIDKRRIEEGVVLEIHTEYDNLADKTVKHSYFIGDVDMLR